MMETETNEDLLVVETLTKPAEDQVVETPKMLVEKLKDEALMIYDPMDEDKGAEKTGIDIRAECKHLDVETQPGLTENQKGEENDSETSPTNDNVKFKQLFNIEDFHHDDDGIEHYTGLPDNQTSVALFNFVKPKDGYQLNYQNNKSKMFPENFN